ncbi:MAG: SH3 domain-containing protein [Chloroflexi bacterium]|nr:SH3 domain-containing protein [Chloroflexota bacterium]
MNDVTSFLGCAWRKILRGTVAIAAAIGMLSAAAPVFAAGTLPTTLYTTRNVFLRGGPGVGFVILAELPAGEKLSVLDKYTTWYKVSRADGTVGWVSGSYLTMDPPGSGGGGASGAPLLPAPLNIGDIAKTSTQLLNVRSGPGLNFPVIAQYTAGHFVTVLDKHDAWRYVQFNDGTKGWVNAQFLTGSLGSVDLSSGSTTASSLYSTPVTPANPTPMEIDIVNTAELNVRVGPGLFYKVVTTLHQGDFVTVLAKDSGWRYIQTAGGTTGWAHMSGLLRCDCALP